MLEDVSGLCPQVCSVQLQMLQAMQITAMTPTQLGPRYGGMSAEGFAMYKAHGDTSRSTCKASARPAQTDIVSMSNCIVAVA